MGFQFRCEKLHLVIVMGNKIPISSHVTSRLCRLKHVVDFSVCGSGYLGNDEKGLVPVMLVVCNMRNVLKLLEEEREMY